MLDNAITRNPQNAMFARRHFLLPKNSRIIERRRPIRNNLTNWYPFTKENSSNVIFATRVVQATRALSNTNKPTIGQNLLNAKFVSRNFLLKKLLLDTHEFISPKRK